MFATGDDDGVVKCNDNLKDFKSLTESKCVL